MKKIYLDYAASTPVDADVLEAMLPYFSEKFGNPSSAHSFGQEAQRAVDDARSAVARFLGCLSQEIVFTGSATEANNLALRGVWEATKKGNSIPHVITSALEHESILSPLRSAEKNGEISVTYLAVSRDGFVDPRDVQKALRPETILVSIGYANNEIGTVQPISKISEIIRNFRDGNSNFETRISKFGAGYPLLHTDAVQAALYLPMRIAELGVDMLTLSGHKIYGPKGIGALYVKKGTPLAPILLGSGQEYGKRSGTENVSGIVGMGKAISNIEKNKDAARAVGEIRNYFIQETLRELPHASLNGSLESRLPHNANVLFRGVPSADLIIALDQEGIAVSAGAACQSKAFSHSHVLSSIGLSEKDAKSSLRFSFGKDTAKKDVDAVVAALVKLVQRFGAR